MISSLMNKTWFEKYRPKTCNDLIFPKPEYKQIVETWVNTGKPDGNIFLYGSGGTGKTSLAEILIKSIIKNAADLKRFISRSVSEVDSLNEFVKNRPISSPIKIVYIEEADRLSNQAQNELKEKYTEKYIDSTIFILTTNYPQSIDPYLLQRFTYKFGFGNLNVDAVLERLKFILNEEKSQYNETDLKNWVEENIQSGLRELINQLQISHKTNNGLIIFEKIGESHDIEDKTIALSIEIIKTLLNIKDIKQKKLAFLTPINSQIGKPWQELMTTTHNNYGIDYQRVLEELNNAIIFQPVKNIITEYMESINQKKYPHLHLLGCLSESIKCISEITH